MSSTLAFTYVHTRIPHVLPLSSSPEDMHPGPDLPELVVEVLQALEQELHAVVAAQLGAGRLAVEDEQGQEVGACLGQALQGRGQAGVVVQAQAVPEPQDVQWGHGRGWVGVSSLGYGREETG